MGLPAASNEPYFDQSKVDEVIAFIECLTLTKATKSGQPEPFELLPHSLEIITKLYGWRRPDGRRLIEKVFASFGRKQAKTQTMAAIITYEFFMGDEAMQEIYFVATAVDQAAICYDAVATMIAVDEDLSRDCDSTPSKRLIKNTVNKNQLKVLSSDGKKQHGFNPSVVVFDELHAFGPPEQELFDALTSGSMSRRNPMWLMITTAGSDKETICGREYEYAKQVLSGDIVDPTYLPIIYEVPKDADWTDKALWPLALPLLNSGHHELSRYEAQFVKAKQQPSEQNKFRRLYLNQWTSSVTQWIPMEAWDACKVEIDEVELASLPCWGGLDLGSTNDFSAYAQVFKQPDGKIILRTMAWIPAATVIERSKREGINYQYWIDKGWIKTTSGKTVQWDEVFDYIQECREKYDLQAVAFDRWKIEYLADKFEKVGIRAAGWGQGFKDMTPAIGLFESLVYDQKLSHDGSPALRWNMDCCEVKTDDSQNKKLVKPKLHQKSKHIDMAVASVMAVAVSLLIEGDQDPYSNGARLVAL